MTEFEPTEGARRSLGRRTVLKGAAWSVPVVAVASAAPGAAASATTVVRGIQVNGECALLGLVGAGFSVAAGLDPIPTGTTIDIVSSALVNVNLISLSLGIGQVSVIGSNTLRVTLTSPLAAGTTLGIRWLLSISVLTTTTATLALPTGYEAGTGSKLIGGLSQTLILCSDS